MSFGFTHSWLREDDDLDRYNKPGSPDWFSLSDDVSFDKPNNRHDALKVESLLGYGGYLDLDKGGGAMGLGPRRLEEPLKAFQEKNGLKVDGLLKPGGPTITKMKQLYGKAFAGSPAPTPAMMDVQAEQIDEGKDGFIYGAAPKPLPKPNKRLDTKTELFDYERWNSDWARNATDPASFAPEYESYIRQIEPTHGHDPGLIYARDFAQKVEKRRGKGGEFVQSLLARLADRPDLQREFLGGAVPHHPPQGTFRPGGEAGVKDWIDQDRIANGIAPKFSKAAQAAQVVQAVGQAAPILATVAGAVSGAAGGTGAAEAPAVGPAPEPDYRNLLEYVNNFGFPGSEPADPAQGAASETGADEQPMTYDDLSDTAKAIASGMGRSRGEPGVQVAMATPEVFLGDGPPLVGGYVPGNRPLPPSNALSEDAEPRGSRQKGPVAPVPEHRAGVFQDPNMRERWDVFNRALDGLPNAGSNERVIYREMYANEGGDAVNPRNFSSSGITGTALNDIRRRGRMPPGLDEHANPYSLPTDRRPEVMRAYFDVALRNAGGHGALNRIDDEMAAKALASTLYFQGEGGGAEAIHNAIRRVNDASPPDRRVMLRGAGILRQDAIDAYNQFANDPARRGALLTALAEERTAVHMRRFNNGQELAPGERAIIDRYRP